MQIPQSQSWERTPKALDRKSNQKKNRKEPNQELKITSNTQIVKFQIPPTYIKKNPRIPFTDSNQTNKKSQTKILLWAPDTIFLETPNKKERLFRKTLSKLQAISLSPLFLLSFSVTLPLPSLSLSRSSGFWGLTSEKKKRGRERERKLDELYEWD